MPDQPDATFSYDARDEAILDVHLPTEVSRGLLFLIHGGFWKQEYDRVHTRPMARALAEDGWLVATPEYRRVRGGGGWPTTGDDVRRAFDSLPTVCRELGVTPGRTVVTGHSAGGHLALWLATTGVPVDRVVALAPVCDLREAIRLGLGAHATEALLRGVDPAEADPMTLLDQRPSCEIAVVHGVADATVPVSLSRGLVERHPLIDLHETSGALRGDRAELARLADCGKVATLQHMSVVASRDLRNHTADVLRQVAEGTSVTVTVHGRPVAQIVPPRDTRPRFFDRESMAEVLTASADPGLRADLATLAGETTDDLGPIA